jgi:hypothetical protein
MKLLSLVLIGIASMLPQLIYAQETEVRKVSSFTSVEMSGPFDVYLKKGSKADVSIESQNIDPEDIITEIRGNTLYIGMKDKQYNSRDNKKSKVYITYTQLRSLSSSGAGNIRTETPLEGDAFTLDMSGAGNVRIDVNVNRLKVSMSGAGSIDIQGTATTQHVDMSGAGSYNGYDLISETAVVDMSGVGSAKVHASKRLEANASGVGSVRYKGNPKEVKKSSNGFLGSVKPA